MASYTKTTNFLAKDSLPLNNAAKYVKGSEIDTEFNNLATADADNLKISALGTGVETALGVNVGSAGAPVLFNGAGGTPSALVGTNITGTAAGLTAGAVAVGGVTGLGTGVGTALGVNVGAAGAPVLFDGALGTPSSGTLTNCTSATVAEGDSSTKVATTAFVNTAGRVLQEVHGTDAGSTTTSTSYANLNTSVVTITPKSATSTLVIECTGFASIANLAGANTTATFQLYDSTNAGLIGSEYAHGCFSINGDMGLQSTVTIRTTVASTGTSVRTFSIRGKTSNALAAAGMQLHKWVLREIAG